MEIRILKEQADLDQQEWNNIEYNTNSPHWLFNPKPNLQFIQYSVRFYGQPKLPKPKELKGIKQIFSIDYIPTKCKCPIYIKDETNYTISDILDYIIHHPIYYDFTDENFTDYKDLESTIIDGIEMFEASLMKL